MQQTVLLFCLVVGLFLDVSTGRPDGWNHGGGGEHNSEQYSSGGEKGDKGYEGKHVEESGAKGHHDKEGHSGSYAEEGGNKKNHHHNDGYYSQHHAGEKGSKGANFEESGSFAKGHSTKGAHSVHKLNEFKKKTDFYDEDHDEAYKENHGGYEQENGFANGGHEAGGHYKKVYLNGAFGNEGEFENGKYYTEDAGHRGATGHQTHHANHAQHASQTGGDGYKKWGSQGH